MRNDHVYDTSPAFSNLEEDSLYLSYSDLMAKSCHTGDDEEEEEEEGDAGKSFEVIFERKIKSPPYSRRYAEAYKKEWRGPSPQLNAWTTQLQRMTQQWQAVGDTLFDLTAPEMNSRLLAPLAICLATALSGRCNLTVASKNFQ